MAKLSLSKITQALDEITGSGTDSVTIIATSGRKTSVRTFGTKAKVRKSIAKAQEALA